ncbi:MAG: flagellar hook-basal body complex protein FliE [Eubacteriales bacterium]
MVTPVSAAGNAEILNKILAAGAKPAKETQESFIPFESIFKEAVNNVKLTEAVVQADAIKVAAGDADALHTLTVDMAKADIALQMLVQVRNKALEAYNEIMRITL